MGRRDGTRRRSQPRPLAREDDPGRARTARGEKPDAVGGGGGAGFRSTGLGLLFRRVGKGASAPCPPFLNRMSSLPVVGTPPNAFAFGRFAHPYGLTTWQASVARVSAATPRARLRELFRMSLLIRATTNDCSKSHHRSLLFVLNACGRIFAKNGEQANGP